MADRVTDEARRPFVKIEWQPDSWGGSYVVSDEGGEFARTDTWDMAIPYVESVLVHDGTLRAGGLHHRSELHDLARAPVSEEED